MREVALQEVLKGVENVLIVDEGRRTGSLSEALMTCLLEGLHPLPTVQRLTGADSFIPLGAVWETVLPSCASIVQALAELDQT